MAPWSPPQPLVTNVHGSLHSIYGLFGLAVLVLTASSLGLALLAMARHTLSAEPMGPRRRFLIPGFGVGLVLTFTLAAFGVFTAGPGHWLPLLLVTEWCRLRHRVPDPRPQRRRPRRLRRRRAPGPDRRGRRGPPRQRGRRRGSRSSHRRRRGVRQQGHRGPVGTSRSRRRHIESDADPKNVSWCE